MSQAESLDDVTLRVPANADVFVAVRADDELLVVGQDEGRQERGVPEDQGPVGRVFVRDDGTALVYVGLFFCFGDWLWV